jgi:hypothetical protein
MSIDIDDLLKELSPIFVSAPVTSGTHETRWVHVVVKHHSEALAGVLAQAMSDYPDDWHRVHDLRFSSVEAMSTLPIYPQGTYTQGSLNARLHRAKVEGRVETRVVPTGVTRDGHVTNTTLWHKAPTP